MKFLSAVVLSVGVVGIICIIVHGLEKGYVEQPGYLRAITTLEQFASTGN